MMRSFIAAFCLLLIVTADLPAQKLRDGTMLDGVVAVVGKYPILHSTIAGQIELYLMQQGKRTDLSPDDYAKYYEQVLESEIDQKVLVVRAELDSINVSEDEIDERLNEQIKMFERQAGGKAQLEEQLGKSITEIKNSPEYRDRARETLLIEKLRMQKLSASTSVSRYDVEEFYREYKDSLPQVGAQVDLATIIKYVVPRADQKKRTMEFAKRLIDTLRSGAPFGDYAAKYSQHPTSTSGGDLGGPYPRGTFLADFEAAAFKLKPGEVSDVVETDQGLHIIKLIERKGEEVRVAQILLKIQPSKEDEDSVKTLLDSIRTALVNGADINDLAAKYSDDPETRAIGGHIGKVRISELAPEQRQTIERMKIGEISEPMRIAFSKTLYGYQIIKLLARIEPHYPTPETDYRDLEATAKQWKQMHDFQKFVTEARRGIYIDRPNKF
jgi:peptidyl-prolyl cis-trans isomerase SurA